MSLQATFRPLDRWPGERTVSRLRAKFKVTYARSLDLLESELSKLRAKYDLVRPCDNCPFLKTGGIRVRRGRAMDIAIAVLRGRLLKVQLRI
jgi:hypothetical protein